MLTVPDLIDAVRENPAPHDDLVTGVRTISHHLWNTPNIPTETRARMREWVRLALDMLHPYSEQAFGGDIPAVPDA
jgi:hypothetical protein